MIIDTKRFNEKWVSYDEETSFKIRPFPFSEHKSTEVMEMVQHQFYHCLVDWKGIKDPNGKNLPCNDDNKKFIFDYVTEIRDFIIQKSINFNSEIDEEVKN